MELMEIIKSSLSIFSAIAFVFILTSYTIYKIKDRTRIKPYLRVNMQNNNHDIIIEENAHNVIPVVMEKKEDKLPSALAVEIKNPQVHERFKIINEVTPIEEKIVPELIPEIEKPKKKIKLNNGKKNIYEYYSDTNEEMHKLKLAVM
jgi:hypothetical protein